MTPADDIFLTARELGSTDERADYVARACQGDPDLLARVRRLLSEADGADAYFGSPDGLLRVRPAEPVGETTGSVIGRYVLEERIGEGGMGVVYRARQTDPIVRQVALKIIKWGMDTRRVVARFAAERQALALMDHPNIARVFDAGSTDTGRPYFVMELVRGRRITEYCDELRLPIRRRIELFIPVCLAVQHAHQKGILHRDLKPSNVLVDETGTDAGEGVPKVIDFGVAKAIHADAGLPTRTGTGGGPVGTLAYMSPEQADGAAADVDTRADIYSLGVLLYELLVGRTPQAAAVLSVNRSRWRTALRRGRGSRSDGRPTSTTGSEDTDRKPGAVADSPRLKDPRAVDPLRPSAVFARLPEAECELLARVRDLPGAQLESALRGDLDWVVMKCLERDRGQRYATANALARELERYLADEPVEAHPATLPRQAARFVRRNRALVSAVVVVMLTLLMATAFSVRWAYRAQVAEDEEARSRRGTEAMARDLTHELYVSRMRQAELFWERCEFDRLRELLVQTADSPYRGFEWDYWMRMAHLEEASFHGHETSISAVDLSRDGLRALTASPLSSVQWWEVGTKRRLLDLPVLKEPVRCVAISSDQRLLLCGSEDGTIRCFGSDRGAEVWRLEAHAGGVMSIALSGDGRTLVSGGMDGRVKAWRLDVREAPRVRAVFGETVFGVAVSADGRLLAAVSLDGSTRLGEVTGSSLIPVLPRPPGVDQPYSLAFSPAADRLALGEREGTIRIWDTAKRNVRTAFAGHLGVVQTMVFSPDGARLYTGGADRIIGVWDAENGQPVTKIRGHSSGVTALAVSGDGNRLLSGSSDASVRVWDVGGDVRARFAAFDAFEGHSDWLQGIQFYPDNRHLLTWVNGAWAWSVGGCWHTRSFDGHAGMVFAAALSSDGSHLVTGGEDRTVRVWDANDGRELRRLDHPDGIVRSLALFPDSRRVLLGGDDQTPWILDLETGREIGRLPDHHAPVRAVAVSRHGDWLATVGDTRTAVVWDAATLTRVHEKTFDRGTISSLDFSPVSTRLLVGLSSGPSRVVELDTVSGRVRLDRVIGPVGIHAARYSPDGRRILIVNESSTGELLDAETGLELLSLRGGTEFHRAGAFSPDGRRIALGTLAFGLEHLVRVWQCASPEQSAAWLAADRERYRTADATGAR